MTLALLPILLVTVLLLILWSGQRRMMYFPSGSVAAPPAFGLEGVEPVAFDTADGLRLHGWFFPVADARATVLVFNGNAGNRSYRAPLASALRNRDLQVLLFDYRGFGGNPGSPTEQGLRLDARAALAYLATRRDVEPARIVYFGESLGSAVAVDLATEHPPAALILRSPFASMTEVAQYHYRWLPVRWLLRDRYDSVTRIRAARAPLLIVAGEYDRIVPAAHSRRLYEAAGAGTRRFVLVEGADHNDDELLAGEEMLEHVDRFIHESMQR